MTTPIDQFTLEEIEAAVAAAENWGTYVTVHGYTPRAVNQAIDAGIMSVEHGQLLDKETLERMAKEGIWLSIQPFTLCNEPGLTPAQNEKQAVVCKGTGQVYEWIKELHLPAGYAFRGQRFHKSDNLAHVSAAIVKLQSRPD